MARLTLRLTEADLEHLDEIRGSWRRGPFIRQILRETGDGEWVPPTSPEQMSVEDRERADAELERLNALTRD